MSSVSTLPPGMRTDALLPAEEQAKHALAQAEGPALENVAGIPAACHADFYGMLHCFHLCFLRACVAALIF